MAISTRKRTQSKPPLYKPKEVECGGLSILCLLLLLRPLNLLKIGKKLFAHLQGRPLKRLTLYFTIFKKLLPQGLQQLIAGILAHAAGQGADTAVFVMAGVDFALSGAFIASRTA